VSLYGNAGWKHSDCGFRSMDKGEWNRNYHHKHFSDLRGYQLKFSIPCYLPLDYL
jgi:hypothetical protein